MKPHVTCHTFSSIDGRIKTNIWNLPDASKYFEEPAAQIKADAWIVGRVTMQEFCSRKKHKFRSVSGKDLRKDFVALQTSNTYAVAIDPNGKCEWDGNMVSTEHVIEVLTEKVSNGYLDHLRANNVSYIFGGKKELDLALVLEKLNKLFRIKTVRIDGGGHVNGAFLKAGLIDEISVVMAPFADGTTGSLSSFEAEEGYGKRKATHLTVKSIKKIYDNFLWIRYDVVKAQPIVLPPVRKKATSKKK